LHLVTYVLVSWLEKRIMDELDHKIITHCEYKGFQKSTELADFFGVGDRTIRRRISNIISNNFVKVIAVPNFILLGSRAWARIGIKVDPGFLSKVASRLVAHHSIHFVNYALGRFDIIISAYFDTMDKLTHFVNSELPRVDGILNVEAMLLVSPRKYMLFQWPATVSSETEAVGESYRDTTFNYSYYRLDEIDRRILDILSEDGLARPASLNSKLGIGENKIRKRMKAMLQNEVYKLNVVPIAEVLHCEAEATIGITINHQSPHKIIDTILEHSSVFLASVSLGRFNLVIATRFHKLNLLNQFVTEFLPSIPGIGSTETYLHGKRLKYYSVTWPISMLIDPTK